MKKRYKYRKITPDDVKEIKELIKKSTIKKVAERFGIHRNTLLYHINPKYKQKTIERAKISRAKLTKEELRKREKKYSKRKSKYYKKRYHEEEEFRKRQIKSITKWQKNKRKSKKMKNKKTKMKVSTSFKKKEFDEYEATEEMEKLTDTLFKKMDKLIEKEWGKKCEIYCWICIACRIWDIYERFKKDLELEYLRKNE